MKLPASSSSIASHCYLHTMTRILTLSLPFLLSAQAWAPRHLDQQDAYANYHVTEGTCFRVKVPSQTDDDGNAYFYNGAYHAQFTRYTSFQLCVNGKNSKSSSCSEYVTTLDQYVQTGTAYLYNLCNNCLNQCGNRRNLQDNGGDGNNQAQEFTVTCSSCPSTCSTILQNNNADESQYLQCQQSHEDGDIAYYSGPQCNGGQVVIGTFYDNECTYKAELKSSNLNVDYTLFQTLQSTTIDCSTGYCNDFMYDAIDCLNVEANSDNDKVCKTAVKATEVQYYARKRKARVHAGLYLFAVVLASGFAFLSYTYYIRHRRAHRVPMAKLDESTPPSSSQAGSSLPTMS
jgi:hypothetical protein